MNKIRVFFCFCFLILASANVVSDPWISPGDEQTRHHVQVLADAGKLKLITITWPLMWSGISQALDRMRVEDLTAAELWSYHYLKHEMRRAQSPFSTQFSSYFSNNPKAIRNFASDVREQGESSLAVSSVGNHYAFKIRGTYAYEPLDGRENRLDGSYGVLSYGNWTMGLGAIDRWWGPAWQNGLILSNNARPAPGVFLKRNESKAFSWPVLRWFGPWDVEMFASQLEEERHIADAKLLGGRLTLKPFRFLELGFSRTAQWGGEGRPQNWDSLRNLVLGRDNRGEGGIEEDGSNEPGNQMAGYDWRFNFRMLGAYWAIYQQRIGEDEKDNQPFQSIDLWGGEVSFATKSISSRLSIENTDTATHALKSEGKGNVIYEHSIYRSGYRYRGRSLAASIDNDGRMFSLNGYHEFLSGQTATWTLAAVELNRDNSPANSPYTGPEEVETLYAELEYKVPVSDNLTLGAGASYVENDFEYLGEVLDSSLSVMLEYQL